MFQRSVDAGIALYLSPLFLAAFGVLLTGFEYTLMTVAGGLALWVSSIIASTFWGPIEDWMKEPVHVEERAKTAFVLITWFIVSYVFLKLTMFMSQIDVTGPILLSKAVLSIFVIDLSLMLAFLSYFILFIFVREVIAKANYAVFVDYILRNFLPARTVEEKIWYGTMRSLSFITVSVATAAFILVFRWFFVSVGWVAI